MKKHTLKKIGLWGLITVFVFLCVPYNLDAQFKEDEILPSKEEIINLGPGQEEPLPEETFITGREKEKQAPQYVPGEVLVKFKEGTEPQEVLKQLNLEAKAIERVHSIKPAVENFRKDYTLEKDSDGWYWFLGKRYKEIEEIPDEEAFQEAYNKMTPTQKSLYRSYKITLPEGVIVEEAIAKLKNNSNIEYAEPNYIRKAFMVPNDPYYISAGSWGQAYDDLWGLKKIHCQEAWDVSEGEGVVVAVIDSGVDYNHPDLWDNIWVNPAVIKDVNKDSKVNLDDCDLNHNKIIEPNEIVNGMFGWDFAYNDNDPMDGAGHGTHCAGTIAAKGNNGIGVIGVAPKARIMIVKGLNDSGSGDDAKLAQSVVYAADNGAKILSNSWGGLGASQTLIDAFHSANDLGCVCIAAAGNSNEDVSDFNPANIDTVIAVAASNQNDEKCDFSNFGSKIDVAAPGGDSASGDGPDGPNVWKLGRNILSLRAGGTDMYGNSDVDEGLPAGICLVPQFDSSSLYYRSRGTSMACPHVSGVAALLIAKYPSLTNKEIRNRIVFTADAFDVAYPVSPNTCLGSGRINAYAALTSPEKPYLKISGISVVEYEGDGDGAIESGEKGKLVVTLQNLWKNAASVRATLSTGSEYISSIPGYSADFGAIAQEEIKNNTANPFIFKANSIEFEKTPAFTLTLIADGFTQTLNFKVLLGIKRLSNINSGSIAFSYNKIVWLEERNGSLGLYLYNLETKQETRISTVNQSIFWSVYQFPGILPATLTVIVPLSPDIYGNKIVWSDCSSGNWDIYLYDLEKSLKERITTNSSEQICPVISGNRIIWLDRRNATDAYTWDIYCYDLEAGTEKQIVSVKNAVTAVFVSLPLPFPTLGFGSTSLFPDIYGNNIIWNENRNDSWDIYLYDLAAGQERQITSDPSRQDAHAIFGNKIVYSDNRNGNADIYLFDLDSNQERQITTDSSDQSYPNIWEDKIIYRNFRDGNEDIYLYDLRTGQEKQLTDDHYEKYCVDIFANRVVWGNSMPETGICMLEIPDISPPARPSVSDEAQFTNKKDRLSVSWSSSDAESGIFEYQYKITQDSPTGTVIKNWTSAGINTSLTVTGLTLSEGKTYYFEVKAKNGAGLWSEVAYSDGITVDTTPPTGTILINNNATYTTTTILLVFHPVTLNLSATDTLSGMGPGAQMKFSSDNVDWSEPRDYSTTANWLLVASDDGTKKVYVKFKDAAGNWSDKYSDKIILDTTAPKGSIKINNGATNTITANVTLNLSATDGLSGMGLGAQMKFSNDSINWSAPEVYATTKSWALSSGVGIQIVYVKFKDAAGNWSSTYSDTITRL